MNVLLIFGTYANIYHVSNILNLKKSDQKIILFLFYLFIFNIIQIVRHWYHRSTCHTR
jgi:hypothetical protein